MSRSLALLLITILLLSSLVMVSSAFAQSIPTPSVPEFTVEYVSGTVEVRIKNQPFVDYYDADLGNTIFFYYNIHVKRHTSVNWGELYNPSDGFLHQDDLSDYTNVSYSSGRWGYETVSFPSGTQVDFQVEAMIGYTHRQVSGGMIVPWVFTGETSGWSETQTITIGENQTPTPSPEITPTPEPTLTPTPYEEPQSTEQEAILGVAITVAVLTVGLGLLVYLIKRK